MAPKLNEEFVYQSVLNGDLEIDSEGRIWRLRKRQWDRWKGSTVSRPCKRVRAELDSGDYLQVRAMLGGIRIYALAHRLVWRHFKGPIPDGLTINHKDGRKKRNDPTNLETATYSEQRHHAIQVLGAGHHDVSGENHPKAQTTDAQVIEMRQRRAAGAMIKDLARDAGMKPGAVSAICTRRTWRHIS